MGRIEGLLLTVIIVNLGGLPVQAQRPGHVNTTTAAPKTPIVPPVYNENDSDESTRRAVSWTVIVAVVLSVILVTVCGFAIKASRRRNALRAARGRRAHGSPMMIYSVTLSCGTGQALTDTINLYRLQNSQIENTECSMDVVKPPPYEEVVDVGFGDNVILGPPPPYSEVTDPASKDPTTS